MDYSNFIKRAANLHNPTRNGDHSHVGVVWLFSKSAMKKAEHYPYKELGIPSGENLSAIDWRDINYVLVYSDHIRDMDYYPEHTYKHRIVNPRWHGFEKLVDKHMKSCINSDTVISLI